MPAFERAEKSNRNFRGARDLREGETAARTQSAEALARKRNALRWSRDYALALQYVDYGCGVQPFGTAQKSGPLQQTHIGLRI